MKHFYLVVLFAITAFAQVNANVERRAAIDIRSGGPALSKRMHSFAVEPENIQKHAIIYFYNKGEHYYELTNFYENWRKDGLHGVQYLGLNWRTSEHAFQAEKFNWASKDAQNVRQQIMNTPTSREAFQIAQQNQYLSRPDWHDIKEDIMLEILRCKFQDAHLSNVLHKTGTCYLIEASPFDAYWGYGSDGKGLNRLGILLMQVRKERFGF